MNRKLCMAAICATGCSVGLAQPVPAGWSEISPNVYIVPMSVQRFGPSIHFAAIQKFLDTTGWMVTWRWAHCSRGWVTDMTAMHLSKPDISAAQAYQQALQAGDLFFKSMVDFGPIVAPFGDATALQKILTARCKSDPQSQEGVELPLAGTDRKVGKPGFNDYLLLRTIVKRGDLVEGWWRRRPIIRVEVKGPDGQVFRKDDGQPYTDDQFTAQDTLARFKVTAHCSQRQVALSRWVDYDKDGNSTSSGRDDAKLVFNEPVPGTVGEAYMDALCRM